MTEMAAAEGMLAKVRRFIAEDLDEEERMIFASLVAPGIAAAIQPDDPEVAGFGLVAWRPAAVPDTLRAALAEHPIKFVDVEP